MARYDLIWSDVPLKQYEQLPPTTRAQVDAVLEELVDDPQHGSYDTLSDQWTVTFGAGRGLILYVANSVSLRVVVLRIACV